MSLPIRVFQVATGNLGTETIGRIQRHPDLELVGLHCYTEDKIGLSADATLWLIERPDALAARAALTVGGVALCGLASAMYIGAQLGRGPRDGLMTGLVRLTRRPVAAVRTAIEVTVAATGWLLGGTVGPGTVLIAFGLGPLLARFLPLVAVRLPPPAATGDGDHRGRGDHRDR